MAYAYIMHIVILIIIFAILAVSLNLALGYSGLINLGHIAFFGIGAYTSALLVMAGSPYLIGLLAAGLLTAFSGFLLALPTARLKGDYLAVATLGFGFIIENFARNWVSVTRGPLGLPGIPKPSFFGFVLSDITAYFVFALIVAIICIGIMKKIINSPFGRVMEAVRDDEVAASALGKNVSKTKIISLAVSAFFAGIAGSLYAHYLTFIDPTSFSILNIILIFSIVILGGLATVKGSIVGAAILFTISEPLRFIGIPSAIVGPIRHMIYGLIILIILYYRPRGLFGKIDLVDNNEG